jgi:DNA-binding transcriptional LysR family regulator
VRENNADLKGKLRISVPRTFIDAEIGQSLIDFAKENPELQLEILAEDRFVDLIEEGFDLAVRITKLEDSGLIARKLSDFRVYAVATADFVAQHGPLNEPQDMSRVPFIVDTNSRFHNNIRYFEPNGANASVAVSGPIEVNSPQATLRAARAGLGVAMVPDFIAKPYIQSGELVTLFDDYIARDRGIYAVYPHRRYLPAKVRSFVDFLSNWFRKNG